MYLSRIYTCIKSYLYGKIRERYETQGPGPVGHEGCATAHAEEAVGDEHAAIISGIHIRCQVFVVDDQRHLGHASIFVQIFFKYVSSTFICSLQQDYEEYHL